MNINNCLLQESHLFHTFPRQKNLEFFLQYLGYENFNFSKGIRFYRTQSFYTLHFVLSGKGQLHFCKKTYDIKAGDIFVLPPAPEFNYMPDGNEPWEYVFFCFNGTHVSEYLSQADFSNKKPVQPSNNSELISSTILESLKRIKNSIPLTYFEGLSLFFSILNSVSNPINHLVFSEPDDIIDQAKRQIDDYFTSPTFSLEKVAQSLYIPHSRLCRIFKANTGMTMVSYLNQRRMEMVTNLLTTTSLNIINISFSSGFRDYTYFLSLFKRIYGITPTQYRKRYTTIVE